MREREACYFASEQSSKLAPNLQLGLFPTSCGTRHKEVEEAYQYFPMSSHQVPPPVKRRPSVALLRSRSASLLPRVADVVGAEEKVTGVAQGEAKSSGVGPSQKRVPNSLSGVRLRPMTAPDKGIVDRFEGERKRAEEISETLSKKMSQMSLKVGLCSGLSERSHVLGRDGLYRTMQRTSAYGDVAPSCTNSPPPPPPPPPPPTTSVQDLYRIDHNNVPVRFKPRHDSGQKKAQSRLDAKVLAFPAGKRTPISKFGISVVRERGDQKDAAAAAAAGAAAGGESKVAPFPKEAWAKAAPEESKRSVAREPSINTVRQLDRVQSEAFLVIDQSRYPLEIFDDSTFEKRSPEQWLASKSKGSSPYFDGTGWKWQPVSVLSYDEATERYMIQFDDGGLKKKVKRLSLMFDLEVGVGGGGCCVPVQLGETNS